MKTTSRKNKTYAALEIIDIRKRAWKSHHNRDKDREFTEQVSRLLLDDESLRNEIQEHPEYLIEMVFVIVDKDKKVVPFFLNEVQRDFIKDLNKAIEDFKIGKRLTIKFLILKGRQLGFTSLITAYQLACTITRKNFEGFTAADEDGNTGTIFENKAKHPYSLLPEKIKPTAKYNNKKQLLFDRLHSSWEVKTASSNMGRSRTINFFHGSECAFWKDGISGVQAGMGEALTKNAIEILESTANGYNEFKDVWDSGKYENKFYEWWRTPEYKLNFETTEKEKAFKERVNAADLKKATTTDTEWIWQRCKWLREVIGLEWNQIYWYFNKWDGYIRKDMIKQEYPCSADEAFLASGKCVFDKEIIIQRKKLLELLYKEKPPKRGKFRFDWNNAEVKDRIKDSSIRFVENPNGCITIYEDVQKNYPYVVGGDTKGEGSDFFAGTAINNVTGNRCAVLHADMDPDEYTHQMYCLGKFYNYALLSIEINFDIYPVKELQRLGYTRQYKREIIDAITKEKQEKYGWKTDGNTRPMIIDDQIVVMRDSIDNFNDIDMLAECRTFVYDKNGRPDAESGKHDDILLSDMIGEGSRSQQSRNVKTEYKPVERKHNRTTGY
ncbi:MAG: hypothetical protein ABFD25_17155 [Clostridiaceae bacterium]